jgi:hypothetical protein
VLTGDSTPLADILVNSSLKQLGADKDDAAVYESMLLDVATVLYGRNDKAAVCAWHAADDCSSYKFAKLRDSSLVKVANETLWVHDIIKSIVTRKAQIENKQSMVRVWLPKQVNGTSMQYNAYLCSAMHAALYCADTASCAYTLHHDDDDTIYTIRQTRCLLVQWYPWLYNPMSSSSIWIRMKTQTVCGWCCLMMITLENGTLSRM